MKKKNLVVLPLIVLVSALMVVPVFAQSVPAITLESSKDLVKSGEELLVTVNLDPGEGNKTNSFIASLSYPQDKLTFESVDPDKSSFKMALQADGGNGKVTIIRGSIGPLKGKQVAGEVKFKATKDVSASEITVNNDSAIIRTSDNTNILPGSTVQNNSGGQAQDNPESSESSGGVFAIFESIKNFFLSFFK